MSLLIELPYNLPGRIYRSAMPFSSFDPEGSLIQEYHQVGISTVVLLVDFSECQRVSSKDLKELYESEGWQVINLPIADFGIPDENELELAVRETIKIAQKGHHLVIHCHAGIGRTGMFAACLSKELFHFSTQEAIAWVRRFIPGAVEMPEQIQAIDSFRNGGD